MESIALTFGKYKIEARHFSAPELYRDALKLKRQLEELNMVYQDILD